MQRSRKAFRQRKRSVEDGASELLDEPEFSILLGDALELSVAAGSCSALGDALTGTGEDYVEVHAKDTGGGVVLDSKIDVFVDAEAEVSCYNK